MPISGPTNRFFPLALRQERAYVLLSKRQGGIDRWSKKELNFRKAHSTF
jgi:hypothetical protein